MKMMNETPITLSEDTTGEVLAGGNLSAPLDRVAIHSVSQQPRYSRYSSNFLPHVLIRIYIYTYKYIFFGPSPDWVTPHWQIDG